MISIRSDGDRDENGALVTRKLPVWLLGSRICPCVRLRRRARSSFDLAWMVPDQSILPPERLALKWTLTGISGVSPSISTTADPW